MDNKTYNLRKRKLPIEKKTPVRRANWYYTPYLTDVNGRELSLRVPFVDPKWIGLLNTTLASDKSTVHTLWIDGETFVYHRHLATFLRKLPKNKSIRTLKFKFAEMTDTGKDIKKALASTTITTWMFYRCFLSLSDWKYINEGLIQNNTITDFSISDDWRAEEQMRFVFSWIKRLPVFDFEFWFETMEEQQKIGKMFQRQVAKMKRKDVFFFFPQTLRCIRLQNKKLD